jgi:hypothetical protein
MLQTDAQSALGLMTTTGTRGQGGRTVFHVPGVVGAAQNLQRRKLSDRSPEDGDEGGPKYDAAVVPDSPFGSGRHA